MQIAEKVREHGFAIVEDVLLPSQVEALIEAVSTDAVPEVLRGGVRNLMDIVPEVRTLAESEAIRALVAPVLGDRFTVVRAILLTRHQMQTGKSRGIRMSPSRYANESSVRGMGRGL